MRHDGGIGQVVEGNSSTAATCDSYARLLTLAETSAAQHHGGRRLVVEEFSAYATLDGDCGGRKRRGYVNGSLSKAERRSQR